MVAPPGLLKHLMGGQASPATVAQGRAVVAGQKMCGVGDIATVAGLTSSISKSSPAMHILSS